MWPPDPGAIGLPVAGARHALPDPRPGRRRAQPGPDGPGAGTGPRVRARPHTKTHKVPNLALEQLRRGAIGICCAKLGEAEVMAAGGVGPILLTTEVVGDGQDPPTARRGPAGDDHDRGGRRRCAAHALRRRRRRPACGCDCLIDVNVGQNRTGVEPGQPALALAERLDGLPGLELVGLQGTRATSSTSASRGPPRGERQRDATALPDGRAADRAGPPRRDRQHGRDRHVPLRRRVAARHRGPAGLVRGDGQRLRRRSRASASRTR